MQEIIVNKKNSIGKSLLTPGEYQGGHSKSNEPPLEPPEVVNKVIANYIKVILNPEDDLLSLKN